MILDKKKYEETQNEIDSLVGDTNIFIKHEDSESIGEIEIMLAEESSRGKHFGTESVLLMLRYASENLKLFKFQAIIGEDNEKSINMFKKIQFVQISEPNYFREISLDCVINDEWKKWILNRNKEYSIEVYH